MNRVLYLIAILFATSLIAQNQIPVYTYNDLSAIVKKKDNVVYVVNFWATSCKPCVKEMPYFVDLKNAYAANSKVKLVLVSLDFKKDLNSKVKPFAQERKLSKNVVILDDPKRMNEWINTTDPNWDGAIPATVWYKNGKKVAFHAGEISRKQVFYITRENLKK